MIDIDIANRVLLSDISELVFEEASITEAYRFLSQNLEGLVARSPNAGDQDPDNYSGLAVNANADLVVFVVSGTDAFNADNTRCGAAGIPLSDGYFTNSARLSKFKGFIAYIDGRGFQDCSNGLAHEIGHTLGSGHEPSDSSIYEDAHGITCGNKRTLMSDNYEVSTLERVSSLDLENGGVVCGDNDTANNERVFAITAPKVAQRLSPEIFSYDGSLRLELSESSVQEGDSVVVTIHREGSVEQASSVELTLGGIGGLVESDLNVALGRQEIVFSEDETFAEFTISFSEDESAESTETLSLSLANGGAFDTPESASTISVSNVSIDNGNNDGTDNDETTESNANSGGLLFILLPMFICLGGLRYKCSV